MSIVAFNKLMEHAERERYAIGYFESWNLESLLAVADAAEATRSPVLLGFSGIYLNHPKRVRMDQLRVYFTLGLEVCRQVSVPATLVFNESPHIQHVMEAIDLGFGLVMFSNENLPISEQTACVQQVVEVAHRSGVAVEGEATVLPGVGGFLDKIPDHPPLTDVQTAREFIEQTGVDAFAVNLGQMHLHGRREVDLNLNQLKNLYGELKVPLGLHGSSSVRREDLKQAVRYGIRKINVGSVLKQVYFEALREVGAKAGELYNPYEIIGSGLQEDVLTAGRVAMQREVEELMQLFGSAGKADSYL